MEIGFQHILLFTSGIFLAIAYASELYQLILKYEGYQKQNIATGYNNAMKIMVLNRFGFVIFTLLISLSIDQHIYYKNIIYTFLLTNMILIAVNILLLLNLHKENVNLIIDINLMKINKMKLVSFIATVFSLVGTFLPWILAAYMPDYRLTLANTGFIFNTLFTLINTFLIEQEIAEKFDSQDTEVHSIVVDIYFSRLISIIFTTACLVVAASLLV